MNSTFESIWYAPAFTSLLESRRELIVIVGAGGLHLGLSLAGLPAWNCPILAATGIPCPGCGLTRATMALIRGDVMGSLRLHAFAPIFLAALVMMVLVLVLPEIPRTWLVKGMSYLETRNGITSWVFLSLMLYWAFRLIA